MFEQATLPNGPAGKRVWTTFLGFGSQVALIGIAVLAPLLWPQVLPLAKLELTIAPPLPPGPPRLDNRPQQHPGRVSVLPTTRASLLQYQPARVPDRVVLIDEQPLENFVIGSPGAAVGSPDGVIGSVLQGLADTARPAAPPRIEPAPAKPAAVEAAPAAPARLRVGGNVKLGALLHRGEPVYPGLAKTTHTQGSVELECVVGVDGHIKEVKVKSGNPLLIQAAVDAAWQWVYEPTKLNGVPIEIITIMTFAFKLN